VITPRGGSKLSSEISSKIDVISKQKIELYQPATAADLLNLENKVYIQKSQLGGGSPMIRGFATNRILLVVDGVRMNTAIFREGNVQNVLSIDPFSIESTDVIFGPASQFYGSDAIGGVLSFQTLKPVFGKSDSMFFEGKINIRASSASNERTTHVDFKAGWQKLASVTSLSYNNFGDLKMGKNGPSEYTRPDYVALVNNSDSIVKNEHENLQIYSGYTQLNFLQKFSYKIKDGIRLDYCFNFSNSSPVPRYDRLLQRTSADTLRNGDWYYGPQTWLMNSLSLNYSKKSFADSFKITLANQQFTESRNDRKFDSLDLRIREETVSAWSANADFEKKLHPTTKINYGAEYILNTIGSTGKILDLTNGTTSPTSTRYPNGSTWSSAGAYVNLLRKWKKWYKSEVGFRYNLVSIDGTLDTSIINFPVTSIKGTNQAVTGSLSQLFKLKNGSIGLITSTAFRSPNIDDVSKVFDRNSGFVIVPNASLKPEYAYNAELNGDYIFNKKLKTSISLFYTFLNNAIGVTNSTLNGVDSIIYDGQLSQVQTLTNQEYATVYGTQLSISYLINDALTLNSSYTILRSTSSNGEPIRHITPNFGGSSLEFKMNKWLGAVSANYNQEFKNNQFTQSELSDSYLYTKDKNGLAFSPSWMTINARMSYQASDRILLNVGLENILDKRYRPYGSGITAPGRNLSLSFKGSF
jgi:hemoglobin/transferrin/lactoferrin receptor protein